VFITGNTVVDALDSRPRDPRTEWSGAKRRLLLLAEAGIDAELVAGRIMERGVSASSP
jgi:hypothetical protein